MSIVILGAGLAGGTAVTELREKGYDGALVLIGAEQHPPYERPPLSKGMLLDEQEFDDALVHDADWYAEHDVDLRLGTRATRIDRERRLVHVESADGSDEIAYEKLLLATGATPRRLDLGADVEPLTLRTVEDSRALRERLVEGRRAVIVGGGWIGLEVAAAARHHGMEVTLLSSTELPLLPVLGAEVARLFAVLHRGHGVDLRLGRKARPEDVRDADLVVAAVGVTPNTELAEAAGLAVKDGILVDARLRTSDERIWAVGDIASHDHPVLGRRIRVEHWDNAIEQAKVAAHNLLGDEEPYERQPYFFTDQYDLGMEYVGSVGPRGYDRVDFEGSTDVLAGDAFRAFWVADGKVVAAMHANDWDASDAIRESIGTSR